MKNYVQKLLNATYDRPKNFTGRQAAFNTSTDVDTSHKIPNYVRKFGSSCDFERGLSRPPPGDGGGIISGPSIPPFLLALSPGKLKRAAAARNAHQISAIFGECKMSFLARGG